MHYQFTKRQQEEGKFVYLDLLLVLRVLRKEGLLELIVVALGVLELHLALLDRTARGGQSTQLLPCSICLLENLLCFLVLEPQFCV